MSEEIGFHRGSMTRVGTAEPPPAVTLSSGSVAIRVRQPSTWSPWQTYGAVLSMRSLRRTRPAPTLPRESRWQGGCDDTTHYPAAPCAEVCLHLATFRTSRVDSPGRRLSATGEWHHFTLL